MNWLLNSKIARWTGIAISALLFIKIRDDIKRKEGKQDAEKEALIDDARRAADIHNRVGNLNKRLRTEDDRRGYRD